MPVTYHVDEHDGGFAYRVGDVWSEAFPSHEAALRAAKSAANRQQVEGERAEITFQFADGRSQTQQEVDGPESEVLNDKVKIDADRKRDSELSGLLAGLGIVEAAAIGNIEANHSELLEAYRSGKITYAALRHSLANDPDITRYANLGDSE